MKQRLAVAVMLVCLHGCTLYNAPATTAAPVFVGSAIAATAARKAVAGGCWANCSKGWHCDEESGVCKRDEERVTPPPTVSPKPAEPVVECKAPLRCAGEPVEATDQTSDSGQGVAP